MSTYIGAIQMGEGVMAESVGLRTEVAISDFDSVEWTIKFPPGWISKEGRIKMTLRVRILDGERTNQIAWGDLSVDTTDGSAIMKGRHKFSSDVGSSGPPPRCS